MPETMPNVSVFDSNKAYNPQAFGRYIKSIPRTRKNELLKSNIFISDEDVRNLFQSQSTRNLPAVFFATVLISDMVLA